MPAGIVMSSPGMGCPAGLKLQAVGEDQGRGITALWRGVLLDLLSKSWHPIIKDTEASTKRVLYQNFDLGVGFIPLYIIDMAQILFCKRQKIITSLREDGSWTGNAVVSGTWDGPVISKNLRIIDTSGTCEQVNNMVRDHMTSSVSSTIDCSNFFDFETSSLNASSQSEIDSVGRVFVQDDQFLQCIRWSEGLSEQLLKDDFEVT